MSDSELEFHKYCQLFPLISGDEYASLLMDIDAHGQIEPIILFEGKILDGRNRYRCCMELEIEPLTKQYEGEDALQFVLSMNLYRRQLTVAQRALIAAELSSLRNNQPGQSNSQAEAPAQLAIEEAAKALGVSPRTVSSACKVVRDGTPELLAAVKTGVVSVSAAEQVSKLNRDIQMELCSKGAKAITKAAKEIREESRPRPKPARKSNEPIVDSSDKPAEHAGVLPLVPQEAVIAVSGGSSALQLEVTIPVDGQEEQHKQPAAKLLFELSEKAMMEGYEPATLAEMILDEVDDGLDMQLLLFTVEAVGLLRERLKARSYRRDE